MLHESANQYLACDVKRFAHLYSEYKLDMTHPVSILECLLRNEYVPLMMVNR